MQTHVHTHYHYGGMSDAQFQQLLTAIQAVSNPGRTNLCHEITDWAATEEADLTAISNTLNGIVTGVTALDTAHPEFCRLRAASSSASDLATLAQVKTQSAALVTQAAAISTAVPGSTTQAP